MTIVLLSDRERGFHHYWFWVPLHQLPFQPNDKLQTSNKRHHAQSTPPPPNKVH